MGPGRKTRRAQEHARLCFVMALMLPGGLARSQSSGSPLDAGKAQTRAPADTTRTVRLSFVSGNVSVSRDDDTGSDAAQVNMPLLEGARLETGSDGQAEIEFEDGSTLRLTPASTVSLTRLSRDSGGSFRTTVIVPRGLVYAELRAAPQYLYRVETLTDAVVPSTNATVRVNADLSPSVTSVLEGTVRVERMAGGGFATDLPAGRSLTDDTDDVSRFRLLEQVPEESWDRWNEERDQAAADEASARTSARDGFAGEQGYGWSDLDANGSWYDVPGQGQVWQPAVAEAPGFDPYANGSWIWYPATGYIWSSAYTWGWTPFRCGSWSYWNGFGWGWRPAGACSGGGLGWRRGAVNIVRGPANYRPPLPSGLVGGPSRPRPIVPVHGQPLPARPSGYVRGPRILDGHVVQPLGPAGAAYTPRGGSAVGASLRRDFPVDRNNHQPVLGMVPSGGPVPPSASAEPWRVMRHGPVRAGDAATGAPATGGSAGPRQTLGQTLGQMPGQLQTPGAVQPQSGGQPPPAGGSSTRQPWSGANGDRRPSGGSGIGPSAPLPQRQPWSTGPGGDASASPGQPNRGTPPPSGRPMPPNPAPLPPAQSSRPAPPPRMPQPIQPSGPSPPGPSSPARSGAHTQPSAR